MEPPKNNPTTEKLQREPSFYAGLILVGVVWSITPLSWALVVHHLWAHELSELYNIPLSKKVLLSWCLVEVVFSIYHKYVFSQVAKLPAQYPLVELSQLRVQLGRILQSGMADLDTSPDGAPLPNQNPPSPSRPSSINRPHRKLSSATVPIMDPNDKRAIDFRDSFSTWCIDPQTGRKPAWETIPRAQMLSWLSWSMFVDPYDNLDPNCQVVVNSGLELMERRAGLRLKESINDEDGPMNQPMRLSVDPVVVWSRPAASYVLVNTLDWAAKQWYKWMFGATFGVFGDIEYMLRLPSNSTNAWSSTSDTTPILFLHGLGVGLSQYLVPLSRIMSSPALASRPIIVPLQPHISQSIWHPSHLRPLGKVKMGQDLKGLIESIAQEQMTMAFEDGRGLGEKRSTGVDVISHSNGTIVHAWLMKDYPELIQRSCFVDPVTFCLWEGDVCYNFVYKRPTNGMHLLMRYFVSTELGIANLIQRNFEWCANTLFFEDIPHARDPSRNMYMLGGHDMILSAERIRKYLYSHGVNEGLKYDPHGVHGSALMFGGRGLETIMAWLGEGVLKQG